MFFCLREEVCEHKTQISTRHKIFFSSYILKIFSPGYKGYNISHTIISINTHSCLHKSNDLGLFCRRQSPQSPTTPTPTHHIHISHHHLCARGDAADPQPTSSNRPVLNALRCVCCVCASCCPCATSTGARYTIRNTACMGPLSRLFGLSRTHPHRVSATLCDMQYTRLHPRILTDVQEQTPTYSSTSVHCVDTDTFPTHIVYLHILSQQGTALKKGQSLIFFFGPVTEQKRTAPFSHLHTLVELRD